MDIQKTNEGNDLYKAGSFNEAIEFWNNALAAGPGETESAQIYYNIGLASKDMALASTEDAFAGKWEGALKALRKCVELNPGHIDAYLQMGIVFISGQFYYDAIRIYEKVISQGAEPENLAESYMGMATCHSALRDFPESLKYLAKAIEADQSVKAVIAEAPDFEKLRNSDMAEEYYELVV